MVEVGGLGKLIGIETDKPCPKHGGKLLRSRFKLGDKEMFWCSVCVKKEKAEEEKLRSAENEKRSQKERQNAVNRLIENAMIAPRFKGKTLENYRVENDGQREVVKRINWFIKNYRRSTGLLFIGKTGTGKNHLASAVVTELIKVHRITALFTTAFKLVRAITETWRPPHSPTETEVLAKFKGVELLVIDEVGVQRGTDNELLYLTELINDRYEWNRPTILSGNVTVQEIKENMGERVIDRFEEGGAVCVFDWESYRKKLRPVF